MKRTTWVHRVWGGMIRSRVTCTRCKQPSDTFDSFLDLSIDVAPNKRTLREMLQGFVKEDRLDGDNAYRCEKYVNHYGAVRRGKADGGTAVKPKQSLLRRSKSPVPLRSSHSTSSDSASTIIHGTGKLERTSTMIPSSFRKGWTSRHIRWIRA